MTYSNTRQHEATLSGAFAADSGAGDSAAPDIRKPSAECPKDPEMESTKLLENVT